MESADVIVVGGGPAGSSCAWRLRQSGLDVVVIDRARFPRDKVCGGWITPQVVRELRLDLADYQTGRTLQPITAFRTGLIGDPSSIETVYDRPVSYGIRRCEFDDYLLRRSGARLKLGFGLATLRRDEGRWTVNGSLSAPMLVGAGGHFCPIARRLNPDDGRAPLVIAREAEFCVDAAEAGVWHTRPDMPELYFSRDLRGYGWCFRKQRYMNVGLGLVGKQSLPAATAAFVRFLCGIGRTTSPPSWRWRGHAYLLGVGSVVARSTMVSCSSATPRGLRIRGAARGFARPSSRGSWRQIRSCARRDATLAIASNRSRTASSAGMAARALPSMLSRFLRGSSRRSCPGCSIAPGSRVTCCSIAGSCVRTSDPSRLEGQREGRLRIEESAGTSD
jgi:hypothetical protein